MPFYNEETGLSVDYCNAWIHLLFIHGNFLEGNMPRRRFLEALADPVQTYDGYMLMQNPRRYQEAMEKANPEVLKQLDALVDEYNGLSLFRKRHGSTFRQYEDKVRALIEGKNET